MDIDIDSLRDYIVYSYQLIKKDPRKDLFNSILKKSGDNFLNDLKYSVFI